MKNLVIPKGVTILCPNCGLRLAILIRDLYKGDTINAQYFKPLVDNIEQGAQFKCIKCSADYFVLRKFFTEELGWLPQT